VGVDAHPRPAGQHELVDHARLRTEVVGRVLGIDPKLDRVAIEPDLLLARGERLAGREANLLGDQVDPGQRLGHRMLDLDPAVDLDEVEVSPRVEQELERPGRLVACRHHRADGEVPQALASGIVHRR
jgi:hypothetical protein